MRRCRRINPKLIYCAVSGFGQNGPERTTAAYDGKIQAMSGIMSVTGHPGDGADAGGLCRVRRHWRHDGGLRGVERALPAHAYRQGPARRCRHAGRDAVVPHHLRHRLHGRRPRAGPVSATGRKAACRRPTCSSARAATSCSPSTTRSSSSRWPRRSAGPTCRRTRASSTGRRGCQRGGAARHHRGRPRRGRRQDLGGAADRGRRALLAGVDHPRDRGASPARPSRRAAAGRNRLRPS